MVGLRKALTVFVDADQHQSQEHIKPLHKHIGCRLVIEGGFHPDMIMPRPPLRVETVGRGANQPHRLVVDPDAARSGEQTVLGGLKTKSVDVVVSTRDTGPSLAVSVKGSLNAFRNLTNRMEEAVGDCTNLHLSYPTLVYGFLHIIRANREGDVERRNDIAIHANGEVAEDIKRYHSAMSRLTNRSDLRNEASRYEAIALALIETQEPNRGTIMDGFPKAESTLRFERFFDALYRSYDLRFVYAAPAMRRKTERLEWAPDSPALTQPNIHDFQPRITHG